MAKNEWAEVMIRDLVAKGDAEIKTGPFGTQLHASDYVEQGTPVINARNIGFGDIRSEKLEFISAATVNRLSSHLLRPKDIVFGRKGTVERHSFIKREQENWFQGTDCLRLRLKGPLVDPRFVSYSFLTDSHKQWIMNQSSHGATMTSLNQDIIGRIKLRLPPFPTQRKITAILSAYDDLIENNTRRIKILEEMAQALYREWFVHLRFPGHEHASLTDSPLGKISSTWRVIRLGDITVKIGSGATPRGGGAAYLDHGITLIRSLNIYDDRFEDDGLAFLSDEQAAALSHVSVEPRDILLNITGASVARCCMVPERHLPARVNQHVMIIRVDPSLMDPFFVLSAINSDERKRQLLSFARVSGATREALTKETVTNFQIVSPGNKLIRQFGEIARDIFKKREVLAHQNALLRKGRDLLLPKLISGEIDVSNLDIRT